MDGIIYIFLQRGKFVWESGIPTIGDSAKGNNLSPPVVGKHICNFGHSAEEDDLDDNNSHGCVNHS